MKVYNFTNVAKAQAVLHSNTLFKLESQIKATATAGLFVQVHDFSNTIASDGSAMITEPEEGAVPLKWWPANQAQYKEFKNGGELDLKNGLYVCLSSTGPTKTLAVGANDKFDSLSLELDHADDLAVTFVFINTDQGEVWAQNAGPKRLLSVKIRAYDTDDPTWLKIAASDFDGETPIILSVFLNDTLHIQTLNFGPGLIPRVDVGGVVKKGCNIGFDLAGGPFLGLSPSGKVQVVAEYANVL